MHNMHPHSCTFCSPQIEFWEQFFDMVLRGYKKKTHFVPQKTPILYQKTPWQIPHKHPKMYPKTTVCTKRKPLLTLPEWDPTNPTCTTKTVFPPKKNSCLPHVCYICGPLCPKNQLGSPFSY